MKRSTRWIVLVTCGLVLELGTGCSTTPSSSPVQLSSPSGSERIRTELFFGLSKRDGWVVSEELWSRFVDENILPRFPDGLTVVDANGRYRGENQFIYREPSKLVILFYTADQASAANEKINALIAEFCAKFQQESVLRADSRETVNFVSVQKK